MKLLFYKYHGTGNDFILVDDPEGKISLTEKMVASLCNRRFGIGADGLIIMCNYPGHDFQMIYYNADGRESSMCGNGGRCIAAFAKLLGRIDGEATFSAVDGSHRVVIAGVSPMMVKLQMNDVQEINNLGNLVYLNTGSPHVIQFVDDVAVLDVVEEGKKIRFSSPFKENGVNVNFVQKSGSQLIVRTYERGVEDETLSCGTGVVASAIAAFATSNVKAGKSEVAVRTNGGNLKVYFEKNGSAYSDVWLEGEATFVYKGEMEV